MLSDIVVDTNVWVHAQLPSEARFESSVLFVTALRDAETVVCIDPEFDFTGAANTSLMGDEYIKHVRATGAGYAVLQFLFANARFVSVSRNVSTRERKIVMELVPRKPRDRTFVKVAYNSTERHLVAHDWQDFRQSVRDELESRLGVIVCEAQQSLASLAA
jgi:hypothetical protein